MLHDRRWSIRQVYSVEELTNKLINFSWCGCTGFELGEHLWLNDSTSPDNAQVYAVVRKPNEQSSDYQQVEIVTVSWCDKRRLLGIVRWIHSGSPKPKAESGPVAVVHTIADMYEALGEPKNLKLSVVRPRIETSAEHGRCELCR